MELLLEKFYNDHQPNRWMCRRKRDWNTKSSKFYYELRTNYRSLKKKESIKSSIEFKCQQSWINHADAPPDDTVSNRFPCSLTATQASDNIRGLAHLSLSLFPSQKERERERESGITRARESVAHARVDVRHINYNDFLPLTAERDLNYRYLARRGGARRGGWTLAIPDYRVCASISGIRLAS